KAVKVPPGLAFIDGEHTHKAVLSDFEFCLQVVADDALIAFHDSYIIYPALEEIARRLRGQKRDYRFAKLGGSISVVSFDLQFAAKSAGLTVLIRESRAPWTRFCTGQKVKKVLPRPAFQMLKRTFVSRA